MLKYGHFLLFNWCPELFCSFVLLLQSASQQGNQNQFYQYNPLYYPAAAGPTLPPNYQGHPPQQERGMTQPHMRGNFLTLQIRIINGKLCVTSNKLSAAHLAFWNCTIVRTYVLPCHHNIVICYSAKFCNCIRSPNVILFICTHAVVKNVIVICLSDGI